MGATKYIVAGRFIDGSGAGVQRGVFLAVQDDVITDIGSAADLSISDGDTVDDLSHCTILPALVDCSVALLQSASVDSAVRQAAEEATLEGKAAILKQHVRYCHCYGVLGLAVSDDMNRLMQQCQWEISCGNLVALKIPAPLSGVRLKQNGESFATGRFCKIAYSSNIDDGEKSFFQKDPEYLKETLSHNAERRVVVANGKQAVSEALDAGCDAIEQGYGMGVENLKRMVEEKVLWIPSVLRAKNSLDGVSSGGEVCCRFSLRYVAPGKQLPGAEAFWKKVLAEQLEQLRYARGIGVKTAVGTGAGGVGLLHGESMVEEIKLFIKCGYSLEKAICCASDTGARFFGMKRLGAIKVGSRATFLITRGTVKQLPRKLSYLEGIYIDGVPSKTY